MPPGMTKDSGKGLRDFYHNSTNSILQQMKRNFWKITSLKFLEIVRTLSSLDGVSVRSERLKNKGEESTRLAYTGFLGELEHLKIETRYPKDDDDVYYKSKSRDKESI
jgi:hypothetical protein